MFNYKDLVYIQMIVKTQNISEAARRLYVSQPSLSQSIQRIENEIGAPLFIRHRHGVELTQAGKIYYEMAIKVLGVVEDMENELSQIDNLQKGSVSFACPSFMGSVLIPSILPDFIEEYPNIDIDIKEASTRKIIKSVQDLDVDFALMHYHPLRSFEGLDYYNLNKSKFALVAAKNHPISKLSYQVDGANYIDISYTKDYKYVLLSKERGIRQVCDILFDNVGITPSIAMETINFITAMRLAASGLGLTITPYDYLFLFDNALEELDFYYIDHESAFWHSAVVTSPGMYQTKIAEELIRRIKEYYEVPGSSKHVVL